MIIQSLINPKVKFVVSLHDKSARKKEKKFIAQGVKTCKTLLEAKLSLYAMFMTQNAYLQYQNDFMVVDVQLVSDDVIKKMSTLSTSADMIAVFDIPDVVLDVQASSVVLYNIQDPGNLGTLIRTAVAMNVENVILVSGADAYQPKVVQATMGTLGYIKIVQMTWVEFVQKFEQRNLCALVVNGGQEPVNIKNSVIVLGNEGQGLPEEIIAACNQKLTIAMPGRAESLNVAIAGAIALYIQSKQ